MELARGSWAAYFQAICEERGRLFVAMETIAARAAVEERIEAMCDGVCTRHPLRHIIFEPSWDTLEVAVGLREHGPLLRFFVAAPRSISVREASGARAILIGDAGAGRTLLCLFATPPRGASVTTLASPIDEERRGQHGSSRRPLRIDPGRRGHRIARRATCGPAFG